MTDTKCATEGCGNTASVHFERHGIGSNYCHDCYMKVQAVASRFQSTPTPASGEQMEVVAHAYVIDGDCEQLEWGVEYGLPDDPALVKLVTLDTASGWKAACMEAREGCNQRSDTIRSLRRHIENAEALNTTLSEALARIASAPVAHWVVEIARTALAALPAKQGGRNDD
jgi:hypothetical protein